MVAMTPCSMSALWVGIGPCSPYNLHKRGRIVTEAQRGQVQGVAEPGLKPQPLCLPHP